MPPITVRRADYASALDRTALVDLLGAYAIDPMGGGAPLADEVRASLCDRLALVSVGMSLIVWLFVV